MSHSEGLNSVWTAHAYFQKQTEATARGGGVKEEGSEANAHY
jgi:hypothetical protein